MKKMKKGVSGFFGLSGSPDLSFFFFFFAS